MMKKILLATAVLTALSGCGHRQKHYVADMQHMSDFQKNVGDRVFFALNSAVPDMEAVKTLKKQACFLKDHEMHMVTVEGHADERGTRDYNMALGKKRAEAVKAALIAQGVEAGRIKTVSYGKERPAVLGHNEEAWAKNRRAVSVIK